MKPLSTDAPGVVPSQVSAARLDRPLTAFGARWVDAEAEHRIGQAAEQAREQARAQGYAAGWAQGRQAAAAAAANEQRHRRAADEQAARHQGLRVEAILSALTRAAASADAAAAARWDELSDTLADGAIAIAQAALGRELATLDAPLVEAVRTAMTLLGEPDEVVVRANAADLALLTKLAAATSAATAGPKVTYVVDPLLASGDVTLATLTQRLRLRVRL